MIKRLRSTSVCINMAIVTVMLIIMFATILHVTREDLQKQSIRTIRMIAEQYRHPEKPVKMLSKLPMAFFLVTIDSDGTVELENNGYFETNDESMLQELIETVQKNPGQNGVIRSYSLRYEIIRTPTKLRIVFMDISSEVEMVKGLVRNFALIGGVGFLIFLALTIFLARWAVYPVEEAWNMQRQFVADASHELKTPLTVIMTNAELLQDPSYTEAERGRFSENILTMSRQMRGLVESLLELARVDNGTAGIQMENVNFSRLVEDGLMQFEPLYFEKKRCLEGQVEADLYVRGSQQHLQHVLEILLDNGAKYSAQDSCVKVSLWRKGTHCLLSVSSPGEPISKEDLSNIFKRFYRIDKARSMNQSYGLGLSIAWNIVESHGGKIWAESTEENNTFFVQLNLAE